jgi:GMP synthase PP-ATPase subunit
MSQAYVAISQDRGTFCFVSAPMIRDSLVSLHLVALITDTLTAVGVQGDARVYGYIAILRAVKTLDFMSAEVRTACLLV